MKTLSLSYNGATKLWPGWEGVVNAKLPWGYKEMAIEREAPRHERLKQQTPCLPVFCWPDLFISHLPSSPISIVGHNDDLGAWQLLQVPSDSSKKY
jgi:hypothetical protein